MNDNIEAAAVLVGPHGPHLAPVTFLARLLRLSFDAAGKTSSEPILLVGTWLGKDAPGELLRFWYKKLKRYEAERLNSMLSTRSFFEHGVAFSVGPELIPIGAKLFP